MTLKARKRFGQNFLHDRLVIQRIVASIHPEPGDHLVEIGPGRGAITIPLLETCGHLEVIELDRDLIEPLARRCSGHGELTIHTADALRVNFCELAGDDRLRIVGNLPYNISTPLLFHLLGQAGCIQDMHFMLQKEVVDRMAAVPGNGAYGRLSVMIQYRCRVTPLFDIGPDSFRPAPQVTSTLVRLGPHREAPVTVINEDLFADLVRRAFAQRRKTLRNNLRGLIEGPEIEALDIDPGARAETLTLQQFAQLANHAARQGKSIQTRSN